MGDPKEKLVTTLRPLGTSNFRARHSVNDLKVGTNRQK